MGDKRHSDLAVIHGLSKDVIAGCLGVFLCFSVSNITVDDILARFVEEDFFEIFLGNLFGAIVVDPTCVISIWILQGPARGQEILGDMETYLFGTLALSSFGNKAIT